MNYETTAKNGFKTFVITLSVSLVIFSAIYYLITDISGNVDIESYEASAQENVAFETKNSTDVKGISTTSSTETTSVFGEINQKPSSLLATTPAVLQAADTTDDTTTPEETPEATVPDTGSDTLFGTIFGISLMAIATYMVFIGPRKMALVSFEQNVLKGLDDKG